MHRYFDKVLARDTPPDHKKLAGEVDPVNYAFSAVFGTESSSNGFAYIVEDNPSLF